ncbi:asparagine synthase (glutamine-hydrolysing) [Actinokineospora iranica]|uniref:Asparagine synthase (Glutamine-hydrolysing) n=2 Tax=Actinokineospora iranica TaxID=1271860 RepID=A0A1G6JPK7_9PSEU|nr:asparagine synthase (glutamine-hydrolysing) [Actinokineospora iranica]
MTSDELARLAVHGVPDDVAWRWPGSYTVVAADDDGRTTIWTDVGGACPIYTLTVDGGVYWSSSSRALAGLTGNHIDPDWLAAWLAARGVSPLVDGRSAFTNVAALPAGHRVSVSANGTVDAQRVWWPRPRHADHVARLRHELTAAVALRVDVAESPTADLSGGYDSTSLVLLAAERLHPGRAVTGVTLHPDGITTGGDASYARLAGRMPGIDHQWLPLGAEHRPFGELDRVPVTDEPAPSALGYASFRAQLEWLRERRASDCHMTGDGGDALICTPALFLADLVRTRRYGRALADVMRWARLARRSVFPLLGAAVRTARTTRTDALDTVLTSLAEFGSQAAIGDVAWFPAASPPSWATDGLRERVAALASSAINAGRSTDGDDWPDFTTQHMASVMATTGRTARADVELAAWSGVPLHNPFLDSRLIDVCLSVPLADRRGPAEYKPLMRAAFDDLFPEPLKRRVSKGDMTPDYYQGLRANLAAVTDMADGRLAELRLASPAVLRRIIPLAAAGVPAAYGALETAISAEVWLRAIDTAPAVPWEAAKSIREAA